MPDDEPKFLHAGEKFRFQWITKELQSKTISSWVNFSSYSPMNLRYLPQPVPKDALGYFQNRFTFADAFEDLLEVSSGRMGSSLNDTDKWFLPRKRQQNTVCTSGINPDQWVASLKDRQLWGAYFSYPSIEEQALRIARDVDRLGSQFSWDRVGDLTRKASMCEEESRLQSINQRLAEPSQASRVDGQGSNSRTLEQEIYELRNPWINRLKTTESQAIPSKRDSLADPSTSEDLFLTMRSMFTDGWSRSIPAWDNIFTNSTPSDEGSNWTKTFVSPDGSKIVTTVKSQPDIGMTQRTELRYDALGNLVRQSSSTRQFTSSETDNFQCRAAASSTDLAVQRRLSPKQITSKKAGDLQAGSAAGSTERADQTEEEVSSKDNQPKGWFWARRA